MTATNGPAAITPDVIAYYREQNGVRVCTGIEVGGNRLSGIVSVRTEADQRRTQPGQPPLVLCVLETIWPCEWREEGKPEILVARRVP